MENGTGIRKYANILVFSFSLLPILLFFFIIWSRIAQPFVFEWGESAGVNQINRILSGAELYAQPSIEFAPLVYTPAYYYLAAGLAVLIGNTLFAARILSLISTIGIVVLIGRIVFKETDNYLLAWISGMFYLGCFSLSDGFFDLARVDSLYVLAVLIAFNVVIEAKNRKGYILFGLLIMAGFFIKQSFVIVFLPLIAFLLYKRTRLSWIGIGLSVIGLIGSLLILNSAADHWFFYYIFELPKEHGYSFISAVNFWIGDTLRPLGIACGFSLVYLFESKLELDRAYHESTDIAGSGRSGKGEHSSRYRWWVVVLFVVGAAGAAWVTRSSNGGGANNCMVIYSALAVGFGLGADLLVRNRKVEENDWLYVFIMLLVSIQFIGLIYNPFRYLPLKEEIQANSNISIKIHDAGSQVLIPYRSHLSWEAGKDFQIHIASLFELTGYFKGKILPSGYQLVDQIRTSICQQSYELIVLDQPIPWFEEQLNEAYSLEVNYPDSDYQPGSLLDWQQGNYLTYKPQEVYDLGKCLSTIKAKND